MPYARASAHIGQVRPEVIFLTFRYLAQRPGPWYNPIMHDTLSQIAPCLEPLARIMRIAEEGGWPAPAERVLMREPGRLLLRAALAPDMRKAMIAQLESASDAAICEDGHDADDSSHSVFQRTIALLR